MPTADTDIFWRRNPDRMATSMELWAVILAAIAVISFFAYRLIKRVPVVRSARVLIKDAMDDIGGVVTIEVVANWISERHPYQFERDTIGTAMSDLSVNGPSSSDYREEQKFLFRVERGEYRLYDPKIDGRWEKGRRLDVEKPGIDVGLDRPEKLAYEGHGVGVKAEAKPKIRHKFIIERETVTTKERKIPVFISKVLPSKCPSCGSPFNGKSGDACDYCGSIIREEEKIKKAE